MPRDYRGVTNVYLAFMIDADTPITIVPIGGEYPGRFALRLGNITPDVSVSTDNATLTRLRDVISAHLDAQAGEPS